MKIIVKTLKGQMIDLEVDPVTTILQIKQKIKELKGFEVDAQKIVLKGKATNNDDTVEKLNIKEKDFLVVMATIKKPESKKQQVKPEQKTQTKPNQQQKPQSKSPQIKPKQPAPKAESLGGANDPAFEGKVNELMGMGFPREKCVQALQAAFGNSDRAVEYLLNGVPAVQPNPGHQSQGAVGGLGALLGSSQFDQLRELLRQDPTALQPILEQLAQTSPELYNLIAQHPQEFEQLIMQGGEGDDEIDDSMEPEGEQIVVTEEEQQAIERLSMLGFSKVEAAQAYLACDKNEEMAANLLFDRLANGDIEQGGFEEDFQEEGEGDDDNLFN